MQLIQDLRPEKYYYKNGPQKNLILLHNTVGYGIRATLKWFWNKYKKIRDNGGSNIGVHFWIGRNGTVIQRIPIDGWAYSSGTGNSGIDQRAISIEIANLGPIVKKGDEFFDIFGKKTTCKIYDTKENGHGEMWRGYRYFEAFTLEQAKALEELLEDIFTKLPSIPRVCNIDFFPEDPIEKSKWPMLKGIISHSHLRDKKDKTDLTIAFSGYFNEIVDRLGISRLW